MGTHVITRFTQLTDQKFNSLRVVKVPASP
jgi:hypothetical protein